MSVLSFEQVTISQEGVNTLEDINLTINEGDFYYLIGKTGSGKSTFFRSIIAELGIQSGTASVAGYSLNIIKRSEVPYLRRKLGFVFQDFQLLTDRNINENLKFVMRATGWTNAKLMDEKIADVLDKVNLKTKGFKMPFELSGGEQQRVGIARAVVNKPPLLLADEPTGNLDPELSRDIMRVFEAFNQAGVSVLVASHDLGLIARMRYRTMTLKGGKMINDGLLHQEDSE
mgnify:CR=1 FL=1